MYINLLLTFSCITGLIPGAFDAKSQT